MLFVLFVCSGTPSSVDRNSCNGTPFFSGGLFQGCFKESHKCIQSQMTYFNKKYYLSSCYANLLLSVIGSYINARGQPSLGFPKL